MSVCVEAALQGAEVLWGAPDYDRTRIGWEETYRAAAGVAEFRASDRMVRFPGGGRITFRSLNDPDSPRGHTADGVVIDEAGEVSEAAWYESLRPTLMDTGGWSWVIGTPRGMNWFWRECMAAADRPDSRFWQAPTLGVHLTEQGLVRAPHPLENPHIAFEEIAQLCRSLPQRVFEQEVLSEFVEESGGVFRGVRAAIDAGRRENEAPRPGARYYLGVDLARVQDWTVLSILDETGRQVYHERFNQISWERQVSAIARAAARYLGAQVLIDSTGVGDMPYETLRKVGVNVRGYSFTNASKENLIDGLALAIEGQRVRLMDLEAQTTELLAYQYELSPSRNVKMNAPQGMHDDCVIALALSNWFLAGPRRQTGLPTI